MDGGKRGVVALAVVAYYAPRGLEPTVRHTARFAILRLLALFILMLLLWGIPQMWSFAAVGVNEAPAALETARQAWIDNHLEWLTLTAKAAALILALAYGYTIWTVRKAIAQIQLVRMYYGFAGFATFLLSGLPRWYVPTIITVVVFLAMFAIWRVPRDERQPAIDWYGADDLYSANEN